MFSFNRVLDNWVSTPVDTQYPRLSRGYWISTPVTWMTWVQFPVGETLFYYKPCWILIIIKVSTRQWCCQDSLKGGGFPQKIWGPFFYTNINLSFNISNFLNATTLYTTRNFLKGEGGYCTLLSSFVYFFITSFHFFITFFITYFINSNTCFEFVCLDNIGWISTSTFN